MSQNLLNGFNERVCRNGNRKIWKKNNVLNPKKDTVDVNPLIKPFNSNSIPLVFSNSPLPPIAQLHHIIIIVIGFLGKHRTGDVISDRVTRPVTRSNSIQCTTNTEARYLQLWLMRYERSSPAREISRMHRTHTTDQAVAVPSHRITRPPAQK